MVVRRAFSLVLIMILSAFDSTRETIQNSQNRNSQDKGGRACVQHNHALAVYREERLQISWTAVSTLRRVTQRLRQCAGQYACGGPERRHSQRMHAEERNESVNVCVIRMVLTAQNLSEPT